MPELPEVETIRRQLARLIVGKTISSIEVFNPGSFRAEKDSLIGKTIREVGRKGKVLILDLKRSDPDARRGRTLRDANQLFVHLKMSGRLEYKEEGKRKKEEGNTKNHLRVRIIFTDRSELEFHDQRKFGWITDDPAALPPGVDALDPKLTPKKLAEILASANRPIKMILLDQSKIAGIGNIYASEILWQAKINPASKGPTLRTQGRTLIQAITKILTDAIDSGGSTMDDGLYRRVGGESGSYWSRRRVYDRAGEPCPRLGRRSLGVGGPACRKKNAIIQKTVIGQRSTYFCPNCQR